MRRGTRNIPVGFDLERNLWGDVLRNDKPIRSKAISKLHRSPARDNANDDPCGYGRAHTKKRETAVVSESDGVERNARAYYLNGLSHEERGEYTSAIRDYDRAISLDPGLAWAYYHRGIAHGGAGHHRKQVEDLRTAARLGLAIAVDMLTVCDRPRKKIRGG